MISSGEVTLTKKSDTRTNVDSNDIITIMIKVLMLIYTHYCVHLLLFYTYCFFFKRPCIASYTSWKSPIVGGRNIARFVVNC